MCNVYIPCFRSTLLSELSFFWFKFYISYTRLSQLVPPSQQLWPESRCGVKMMTDAANLTNIPDVVGQMVLRLVSLFIRLLFLFSKFPSPSFKKTANRKWKKGSENPLLYCDHLIPKTIPTNGGWMMAVWVNFKAKFGACIIFMYNPFIHFFFIRANRFFSPITPLHTTIRSPSSRWPPHNST